MGGGGYFCSEAGRVATAVRCSRHVAPPPSREISCKHTRLALSFAPGPPLERPAASAQLVRLGRAEPQRPRGHHSPCQPPGVSPPPESHLPPRRIRCSRCHPHPPVDSHDSRVSPSAATCCRAPLRPRGPARATSGHQMPAVQPQGARPALRGLLQWHRGPLRPPEPRRRRRGLDRGAEPSRPRHRGAKTSHHARRGLGLVFPIKSRCGCSGAPPPPPPPPPP